MNKKILALVLTAAITFSSAITAFAADTATNISLADSSNPTVSSAIVSTKDTATKISLDDRTKLSVSLQSNSLVFSNEPTDQAYDNISIDVINNDIIGDVVRTVTYNKDTGATINLNGLSDGSYKLKVFITNDLRYDMKRYAFTIEVKGGSASFKSSSYYANNLKITANERTDAYALDWYKSGTLATDPAYVKQANLITAGITDDYAKVKAIHDWVASNMSYDYGQGSTEELFPGSGTLKSGICENFTGVTMGLYQAAGFPAKWIDGGTYNYKGEGHTWTEVYVDNRWVFSDTTWDYFDKSIAEYSVTHELSDGIAHSLNLIEQDRKAWNGSLYIMKIGPNGINQGKVLQEIKDYPLGGLVTSTYGYNANDMYSDAKCTKPWNFKTDKVGSYSHIIYVKMPTISVTFDTQGGTAIKSVEVKPNADGYCKIPQPANPTRSGYTFTGWVIDNPNNSTVWDFKNWTINYDRTLYATWKKTTDTKTNYTVSFNTQGGTAVKALTINANSTITKPATPTRKGYKFVNWYKDSKCTKVWNFATDKVTANTTLYAGWAKTYTVSFNSNGGTAVKALTVNANSTIVKPKAPTRKGYKFVNWYKDSKCTKVWNFATDKVTANTTLYAKWKK